VLTHSFHKFTQSLQANSLRAPELVTESTVLDLTLFIPMCYLIHKEPELFSLTHNFYC